MWLVSNALRRPYTVYVAILLVVVLGCLGYSRTPTDILPNLKVPVVVVFASYRGMPAPDMEQVVVKPFERALTRCDHLERIESRSLLGIGIIKIYFRPVVDPDAVASQVIALVNGEMANMPPGMLQPTVLKYDASAIPVGDLVIYSDRRDDKELLDLADTKVREAMAGIEGLASAPVFGGVFRQVQVYVDPRALEAMGMSPLEVARIVNAQSQVIPTGELRVGPQTYFVSSNAMAADTEEYKRIPLYSDGRRIVRLGDVAEVIDGQRWRTNIVNVNGKRAVYMPLLRQAGASAVAVIDRIQAYLPTLHEQDILPEDVRVEVAFDQSKYARDALASLRYEGIAGAGLAALVVLLFLGNLRGTGIVAVSIPLSVLAALAGLYITGQTLNVMTLGGLALVVGRIIDDSIVDVENTTRHLEMNKPSVRAVLDSAREVSLPVLLATLATCIVFAPLWLMTGIGRDLFAPLGLAASMALLASYVVSRTVSPLYNARYLHQHHETLPRWVWGIGLLLILMGGLLWLGQSAHVLDSGSAPLFAIGLGGLIVLVAGLALVAPAFGRWFHRVENAYAGWLTRLLRAPLVPIGLVGVLVLAGLLSWSRVGQELFPEVDSSEFTLHIRVPGGPRVEETERVCRQIEATVREMIPAEDLSLVLLNAGISSRWSAIYTPNNGPHAAFLRFQLRSGPEGRRVSVHEYVHRLRPVLAEKHPACDFFFESGGMVHRILNAGAVAPIEVRVIGDNNDARRALARRLARELRQVPTVQECYLPQGMDLPQVKVNVDRQRAALLGLTESDVVRSVIISLMSSAQLVPNFWIDPRSGNPYFVGIQYPEYLVRDLKTLEEIPLTPDTSKHAPGGRTRLLRDLASLERNQGPIEVHHRSVRRTSQVMVNVTGNDLAGSAAKVRQVAADQPKTLGLTVEVGGEVETMRTSMREMGFTLVLAVLLVYLLMVAQFASWVDPFVAITAAPLAIVGVGVTLWLTDTSLNVQSAMGILMLVGISVSNSVLLVQFANERMQTGATPLEAAIEAGRVRLRPIIMTTLATIAGLVPLAIHFHPGGEMNLPLARAVIGGMLTSTALTLFLVPALYVLFKRSRPQSASASA